MKIAVIGSGISGLGASLLLGQKHEVHLFESDTRLGGHAHTSTIRQNGGSYNVDTGFLVYNDLTYPHLRSLFRYLGVETIASDMSLSVQEPNVGLEWAGDSLNTVFAQRKNLLNPRFYRLVRDILRFHRSAEINRALSRANRWTVEELFHNRSYSRELKEWYILPMIAAIWSTPEKSMLKFPAETFLTFFINHKLLQVNDRPVWRTVKDGSVNYVNKVAERLRHVHLNEAVVRVKKTMQALELTSSRQTYHFDKIIFATQPALTSRIYEPRSSEVARLLGCFKSESNRAFLHKDRTFMPNSKRCWSSWNVQAKLRCPGGADTASGTGSGGTAGFAGPGSSKVALTYFLNRLQSLKTPDNILLTLNPERKPAESMLQVDYDHPVFDQTAIDAQTELPGIQGHDGIYFAGAWTRYGFHEDGLLSAVNVARHFEIQPPWEVS